MRLYSTNPKSGAHEHPRAYVWSPVQTSRLITSEVIVDVSKKGDIETVARQYNSGEWNDNTNNHEN